jgi:hypothetical protein
MSLDHLKPRTSEELQRLQAIFREKRLETSAAKGREDAAASVLHSAVLNELRLRGIHPGDVIEFAVSKERRFYVSCNYEHGLVKFHFRRLKADGTPMKNKPDSLSVDLLGIWPIRKVEATQPRLCECGRAEEQCTTFEDKHAAHADR